MKKKILSAVGAIALAAGIALNIQYSLADYGMGSNTLSTFVLAQSGSSGGSTGGSSSGGSSSSETYYNAKAVEVTVHCKKAVISGGSQGSSSGASGGVSVGGGGVSAGISGGTGSSGGSSSSEIITEEYTATKILCYPYPSCYDICTTFDPCFQ